MADIIDDQRRRLLEDTRKMIAEAKSSPRTGLLLKQFEQALFYLAQDAKKLVNEGCWNKNQADRVLRAAARAEDIYLKKGR